MLTHGMRALHAVQKPSVPSFSRPTHIGPWQVVCFDKWEMVDSKALISFIASVFTFEHQSIRASSS